MSRPAKSAFESFNEIATVHIELVDSAPLIRREVDDPERSYPRYVGGKRNAPPEDCGGLPGFYEILAAVADPDHPDHAEILD